MVQSKHILYRISYHVMPLNKHYYFFNEIQINANDDSFLFFLSLVIFLLQLLLKCIHGFLFLFAGSYVTHETNHFVYFYLDQKAVLLFKSG